MNTAASVATLGHREGSGQSNSTLDRRYDTSGTGCITTKVVGEL